MLTSGQQMFFCGVGGSGMSALALILRGKGMIVHGSDRGRDKGDTPEKFAALEQAGIKLFPQDGSGLTDDTGMLVVSSAVEDSIPDVRRAKELGIQIRKRAEVLAELVNGARGICIGGTSGKTTVTGMVSHMLYECGLDPSVMNGGQAVNFLERGESGNARVGGGDVFVTETDESDGSIMLYNPAIAVLNNITLDHKPLDELRPLFRDFVVRAREAAIINLDDPEAAQLAKINPRTITFSYDNPQADLTAKDAPQLKVPGRHNVMNALAALAVAKALGVTSEQAGKALESFKGIKRRFEIIGTVNGITVIDDFAHNPDKIEATLNTVHMCGNRVIAIFQPHGFGPTKMLKDGLVKTFAENLAEGDILLMPEIYYAGGTANKTISSRDITDAVAAEGREAHFMPSRDAITAFVAEHSRDGDRVVLMGARDDTLPEFARTILESVRRKAA